MAENCCTTGGNIMILACSGGSNVGQLSNQAAVELTQEGFGKMFCLAGIGGQISGFVQSAKDVPMKVAIDGCQVGCAKAILNQAQVPLNHYVVLTDGRCGCGGAAGGNGADFDFHSHVRLQHGRKRSSKIKPSILP